MSNQPRSFLGASKRVGNIDRSVTLIELDYAVQSGVQLKSMGMGMVPLVEEHEARLERGIGLDAWLTMPLYEKAMIIALRRIKIAMQNLQTEAEIRDSERKTKKGTRR